MIKVREGWKTTDLRSDHEERKRESVIQYADGALVMTESRKSAHEQLGKDF